jgi:hypothetical protein
MLACLDYLIRPRDCFLAPSARVLLLLFEVHVDWQPDRCL